jgi:excisionase family DNA binding protein
MPDVDHGPVTLEDLRDRSFATVEEVAQILMCDRRTIRTACRQGEIPSTKTGVLYRIPVSWLVQQARMTA